MRKRILMRKMIDVVEVLFMVMAILFLAVATVTMGVMATTSLGDR